jgi:aminomethyltransferase
VSHMGEIRVKGQDAFRFLQKLCTNTMQGMKDGKVRYSPLCYPSGGTVDDVLVYRLSGEEYLLVVNASNKDKDLAWITDNATGFRVAIQDESDETAEVALQGPAAAAILEGLSGSRVTGLGYYEFLPQATLAGAPVLVSRTGYTGEDGFEIYCRPEDAEKIWDALIEAGKPLGLQPAGLGCRDTLRFEASMPLYGHELSAEISPLEAGLSHFVAFDKGEFNGRDALLAQKEQGLKRKLVGFEMLDRGVARSGYPVLKNGERIGHVTSGTVAPTLGKNLGMALVRSDIGSVGTEIDIEIREKAVRAKTISRPFYKRGK